MRLKMPATLVEAKPKTENTSSGG